MNKDDIVHMTEEWIKEKGNITCEFRISFEEISSIYPTIVAQNKILEPQGGFWTIRLCSVCKKYDESAPFHVEIERKYD